MSNDYATLQVPGSLPISPRRTTLTHATQDRLTIDTGSLSKAGRALNSNWLTDHLRSLASPNFHRQPSADMLSSINKYISNVQPKSTKSVKVLDDPDPKARYVVNYSTHQGVTSLSTANLLLNHSKQRRSIEDT